MTDYSDLDGKIRAKIASRPGSGNFLWHSEAAAALSAVLDIHQKDKYGECRWCSGGGDNGYFPYPCSTVEAIARALEVSE